MALRIQQSSFWFFVYGGGELDGNFIFFRCEKGKEEKRKAKDGTGGIKFSVSVTVGFKGFWRVLFTGRKKNNRNLSKRN